VSRKPGPSSAQRGVLSVLARGGFIDPGNPGESCPRLYEADARLFALIARGTFDVLRSQGWVTVGTGPLFRRPRYVASAAGRSAARRFRP
jgi:hypothetical protein